VINHPRLELVIRTARNTAVFFGLAFGAATSLCAQNASVADTGYQEYRDPLITLPYAFGIRMPQYDRVNGLSLPWGPRLLTSDERFRVDALLTYRSHLGDFDPWLAIEFRPDSGLAFTLEGGRASRTNDRWIEPNLINSLITLAIGRDARNYYRADLAEARATLTLGSDSGNVEPYVGARIERAWSTGFLTLDHQVPYSFGGRTKPTRIRRINPAVAEGNISSAIAGVSTKYERADVEGRGSVDVEVPFSNRVGEHFVQVTVNGKLQFTTFGTQRLRSEIHAVMTSGDGAPPQRFAYLGGPGTLKFVDLLELGGDHLFFFESRYIVPIDRIQLPLVGPPEIALRYLTGSAGVRELPDFIQNIGLRLTVAIFKVDFMVNPENRDTEVSIGLQISR
jgi:hypothetical protein